MSWMVWNQDEANTVATIEQTHTCWQVSVKKAESVDLARLQPKLYHIIAHGHALLLIAAAVAATAAAQRQYKYNTHARARRSDICSRQLLLTRERLLSHLSSYFIITLLPSARFHVRSIWACENLNVHAISSRGWQKAKANRFAPAAEGEKSGLTWIAQMKINFSHSRNARAAARRLTQIERERWFVTICTTRHRLTRELHLLKWNNRPSGATLFHCAVGAMLFSAALFARSSLFVLQPDYRKRLTPLEN